MTARITLALLFVIPAAMAYPWPSVRDRWVLGVAAVVVLVLFAWWRGEFLTTMLLRRNRKQDDPGSSERTTVLLRVDTPDPLALPLNLIASYLDRYGIRCDKVRVTTRDVGGQGVTWIGLTVGAADNLAALQARSSRIPLHDTAEVVARRLADHLRETGWNTSIVDSAEAMGEAGYLAAYSVRVDDRLADTFSELRSMPSVETWTALEYTGKPTDPEVSAACALRTAERPAGRAPIPALTPLRGRHRFALAALNPLSTNRLTRT